MVNKRNHDTLPEALQPFSRALAVNDALPERFRPSDIEPLRHALAGSWPTIQDLRSLVTWWLEKERHNKDDPVAFGCFDGDVLFATFVTRSDAESEALMHEGTKVLPLYCPYQGDVRG